MFQQSCGSSDKRDGDVFGYSEDSAWAEFTSFQVRRTPRLLRQHVAGRSVDDETLEQSSCVPHIKLSTEINASTESEYVDVDRLRRERFWQRNVHGHSTDSSVARLLYGQSVTEMEPDTDVVETGMDTVIVHILQLAVVITIA